MSVAVIAFAIAAGLASADSSQPNDSRVVDPHPQSLLGVSSGRDARRILNSFTDCAVVEQRGLVDRLLAAIPGSREEEYRVRQLKATGCNASVALFADDTLIRGALYESLYLTKFGASAPSDLSRAGPINYAGAVKSDRDKASMQVLLRLFADCVTRRNPGGVRALIMAEVGTKRERLAFEAIGRDLSDCLVPDAKLEFSFPSLRGYLAETLYRLSEKAPLISATHQ